MTDGLFVSRASGWQLILADLALILFLLAVAALSGVASNPRTSNPTDNPEPAAGPSQALYRAAPGTQSLTQWLRDQPRDPRASLTIYATYEVGSGDHALAETQALADQAVGAGYNPRMIVEPGEKTEVFASLAFDATKQLKNER
ncbi:MAG: hypothetical protein ABJP70_01545 [Erythrobacter sp.]